MIVEIKKYRALPCELETFIINRINANIEDFGSVVFNGGSCMDYACGCHFKKDLPTQEVLDKYNITLKDYAEVCEKLEKNLCVCNCGWCS